MKDRIIVRVRGRDGLYDKRGVFGECEYVSDDPSLREFIIDIALELDDTTFAQTLAHEMVHVKQYAKGEMVHYSRDFHSMKWQKQRINTLELDYWDLPWEIEAHGREQGLFYQFLGQYSEWQEYFDYEVEL
jgi:hypothetical protein